MIDKICRYGSCRVLVGQRSVFLPLCAVIPAQRQRLKFVDINVVVDVDVGNGADFFGDLLRKFKNTNELLFLEKSGAVGLFYKI